MSKTIALKPHLSEKTYAMSEKRVYAFIVPSDVNKHSVARAVEAQFEVKVTAVNITNQEGKAKRTISINGKRSMNATGKRSDVKKAYVTLAEGFSLPLFAAIDEAAAQEQETQEKIAKVTEKQAAKEAKPARRGLRRTAKKEEDK
ncbi:MAG: ribosomal protein [Candidatus Saccharibacteria bacterium]|nr:ribosomal protein [Candidatus Saccharibacteria bacterium]